MKVGLQSSNREGSAKGLAISVCGVSYDWVHMGSALSGNTAAYFDDVFVGPVPEPTTVALVGLGGLFLGARYLRRRK